MAITTKEELEKAIGYPSGSQNIGHIRSLTTRLDALDIGLKTALQQWLAKQGLPDKAIKSASTSSIVSAYTSKGYLRSWRNRVNPSWALLDGANDSDDDDTIAEAEAPPPPAHIASPTENPATEKWLRSLFEQINKAVEVLVAQRLDAATIKIDPAAKLQIQTLAKQAAQDRIDEISPPRRIEVHDTTSGTVTNLGLQHERFPFLLRAMQARDHRGYRLNIWLTGPTGSGKTSAAEFASKALSLPFGSDGSLDADYKVLGFRDANGNIISTQFLDIYEKGGVYVADEIDNWMPSALLSLNAALANGWVSSPRGMIQRHRDAVVIACANTWGLGANSEYVGRTRLDAASLDRFQPKIDWPYDERLERAIADAQAGEDGLRWHAVVVAARQAAKNQGLKIIISPRATFNGIALLAQGFERHEVIDMTIAAGISPEQKKAILPSEASHSTATQAVDTTALRYQEKRRYGSY